jgi:putative ABC transport system permease protein
MKLAFQLALRNLLGSGLRTALNAGVLSFSFVLIIFFNGMLDGWNEQARRDGIAWEFGQGQLLHEAYDPQDPFSIQEGHGPIPDRQGTLVPILMRQASIYPEGRMLSVTLKGIDPAQKTLRLPTQKLAASQAEIPAIIGQRMAESAHLKVGDQVLLRWRDRNGTFDAGSATIVDIFDTDVSAVDNGQIWIAINQLWEMTGLAGQATLAVFDSAPDNPQVAGWTFESKEMLLQNITQIIEMKKSSGYILFILLLGIALLAIFDTQVLSIFRRQKEIGTYVALGMTRQQVVGLFTVEGGMYSLFALVAGALYGIPLFIYFANHGIGIPPASQNMGVALAERIFPVYGFMLVTGTILVIVLASTLVSYLPARKIATLNPVNALKGKLQ